MISVIICTHNRADVLRDTLNSFSKIHSLYEVDHELFVIDNNSTDATRMVVEEFSTIKTLRYVLEEKLGLSYARNRGIKESSGQIIAFVDDDVFFGEDWLIELKQGINKWTDAAGYGGRALPYWEIAKPPWFVDEGYFGMQAMVSHFEPNTSEGYMNYFPYGLNMAFRRSIFEKIKFDVNLGRKGAVLLASEEKDLYFKIREMGGRFVYLPKATVFHRIMQDRGEKEYFLRWTKSQSKSQVYLWIKHNLMSKKIFGVPLNILTMLIRVPLRILKDFFLFRDTNRFFSYRIKLLRMFYYIRYFRMNKNCR